MLEGVAVMIGGRDSILESRLKAEARVGFGRSVVARHNKAHTSIGTALHWSGSREEADRIVHEQRMLASWTPPTVREPSKGR